MGHSRTVSLQLAFTGLLRLSEQYVRQTVQQGVRSRIETGVHEQPCTIGGGHANDPHMAEIRGVNDTTLRS